MTIHVNTLNIKSSIYKNKKYETTITLNLYKTYKI